MTWLDLAERCQNATGPDRACPRCNVIFQRGSMPPSQWARKVYCSPACGSAAYNEAGRLSTADALAKLFDGATQTATGCILPDRKPDAHGYVIARAEGKLVKAHRLSYESRVGIIPSGMVVMHKCDVRNCINPDHLTTGAASDNNRDRDRKGRQARGEHQGRARLTEDQVRLIRASLEPTAALAQRFSVGETAIHNVRTGKRWRHVQ